MLKGFSFFFIILTSSSWACGLKQDIVSISAPITGVLKELGLLSDPHLKAISLFHPVKESEFKGPRLGGGLFLSQKGMAPYKETVFFYDQSAEITRRIKVLPFKRRIQVRTRGLDPFVISNMALTVLTEVLVDCETSISRFQTWIKNEKDFQMSHKPLAGEVYFFLGEILQGKLPKLLMVKDGPISFWITNGKIKTFDSPLSYVNWGEKWKKSLSGTAQLVGLVQTKSNQEFRIEKVSENHMNIFDPYVLSPGTWQIRFMRNFVKGFK